MPSPEATARPLDARLHRLEAALLALVGLACLVFQLRLPGRLPSEQDFAQVAQVLTAEAKPGDAVLLYPWWTERARLFVPAGLEVVGFQGSDGLALAKNPRIWVLAQPHLPRASWDEFLAVFSPSRAAQGPARDFGNLRLQLFENGRYRAPVFTASDSAAQLKVFLELPSGEQRPCSWDGRAHRCPGGYVAAEWHETLFQPRHCLRFFPPGGPVKLVAELPAAPAAAGATFEAGFIWDRGSFRDPSFTVTTLGFGVAGGEQRTMTLAPGVESVQRLDVGPVAANAALKMTVQSDNPTVREVCADLVLWGKP